MENLSTGRWVGILRLCGLALLVVGMAVSSMIFLAIAIGYCVHWVLPAVELGTACTMASITLATLVFCCAAFLVAGIVVTAANHQNMEEDAEDEAADEAEAARTLEAISEMVFQKMQDSVIHESIAQLRQSKKRVRH